MHLMGVAYTSNGGGVYIQWTYTTKESFLIIYLCCTGDPAYITSKQCPEINRKAIYKWYSTLREIVKQANELHPLCFKLYYFICQAEYICYSVQIDETLIGKRRKYNKGKYFKQEWLLGMSQQKEHLCYVTLVEKRDKKTLNGFQSPTNY